MKSWKTTLLGVLAGAAMCFGSSLKERATNPAAPPITFGNVVPGVLVAVLGMVAKDSSNTTDDTKK